MFHFIKTKDIFHELIHPHNIDKENLPLSSAHPPQDLGMDSLPEEMNVMPRPSQDFSVESLVEDMDSVLEPILMQDFEMNSLLEPNDTMIEDMDSVLEPITFDSLTEDMDSVLEPITINNSSNVDEVNEIVCRLDSLLEPVVLVERC